MLERPPEYRPLGSEAQRHARELKTLSRVSGVLGSAHPQEQVLTEVLSQSAHDAGELDDLWTLMRGEAHAKAAEEPILGSYFHATILNHDSFGSALSFRLASKLDNPMLPTMLIRDVIKEAMDDAPDILRAAEIDVLSTYARDAACTDLTTPFLFAA